MEDNIPKGYDYKPCPPMLFIADSNIHGFGVFSNQVLEENLILCHTHQMCDGKCLRVNIGGFINHSYNPNCAIVKVDDSNSYYLKTLKEVLPMEEITVNYSVSVCGLKKNQ